MVIFKILIRIRGLEPKFSNLLIVRVRVIIGFVIRLIYIKFYISIFLFYFKLKGDIDHRRSIRNFFQPNAANHTM